ncbi:hypothetical protein WI560_15420 [Bradyrhizobium sp. A11]|uniref:hypothetical protein n=1 Tax=Bradyrhizobium sp. A11 TaxID=3133974 RepID=UPI003253D3B9
MENVKELPAESLDAILSGPALQELARRTAIHTLARLRKEARAEITKLIDFLDASDPYVMTELEDDISADLEDGDPAEDDDPAENGLDDEPSLGSLERHPSAYGPDDRNWTGDQTHWAASGTKDLEDEHDGAEPGEDDEPSLGWTTSGVMGTCLTDREQDDCDREDNEPLLGECV